MELVVKNLSANVRGPRDTGWISESGHRRRAWQPTPVILSGESHEQRSLAGYTPWSRRVRNKGLSKGLSRIQHHSSKTSILRHSAFFIVQLSHPQSNRIKFQFSSVTQSCPALCDPMNRSMPGLPIHHQFPEPTQTHVHRVGDAIILSHPLSSPSPPALNLSQLYGLFK